MHTIHKSIYAVITKPRNGNCEVKKSNKNLIQFTEIIKHN